MAISWHGFFRCSLNTTWPSQLNVKYPYMIASDRRLNQLIQKLVGLLIKDSSFSA